MPKIEELLRISSGEPAAQFAPGIEEFKKAIGHFIKNSDAVLSSCHLPGGIRNSLNVLRDSVDKLVDEIVNVISATLVDLRAKSAASVSGLSVLAPVNNCLSMALANQARLVTHIDERISSVLEPMQTAIKIRENNPLGAADSMKHQSHNDAVMAGLDTLNNFIGADQVRYSQQRGRLQAYESAIMCLHAITSNGH